MPPCLAPETSILNYVRGRGFRMATELEHECPECGEERTFWRSAATNLHLGQKTKWVCPECDYSFVRINGNIDSSASA